MPDSRIGNKLPAFGSLLKGVSCMILPQQQKTFEFGKPSSSYNCARSRLTLVFFQEHLSFAIDLQSTRIYPGIDPRNSYGEVVGSLL